MASSGDGGAVVWVDGVLVWEYTGSQTKGRVSRLPNTLTGGLGGKIST